MQPLIKVLHQCELYGNGAALYLHLVLIHLMSVKKNNKASILTVSMTWNYINQQGEAKPVNLPHAPSHFHFPFKHPPSHLRLSHRHCAHPHLSVSLFWQLIF